MKSIVLTGFIVIASIGFVFSQTKNKIIENENNHEIHFIYVDNELDSLIKDNLVVPSAAQEMGVYGEVTVWFNVDTLGNIDSIRIKNANSLAPVSNNMEFDRTPFDTLFIAEARRLFRFTNGLWIPAMKNRVLISTKKESSIYFSRTS